MTAQIVTRYKAIFKNDPTFREPESVMLKSSDDFILFGEDLIKDVLNDMCQVHLIIETCKSAPTLSELYDQSCLQKTNCLSFKNIKEKLKDSEANGILNLSSIFIDKFTASNQIEIICDSIKLNSKQQINLNTDYYLSLTQIDLSGNFLTDQMVILFIENVFIECTNLKSLNLAFNLITAKSLKALNELANSFKQSNKTNNYVKLIYLNNLF